MTDSSDPVTDCGSIPDTVVSRNARNTQWIVANRDLSRTSWIVTGDIQL
jgi:hypothetical protein